MTDHSLDNTATLRQFCQTLPKVELHAHLNGSLSPTTLAKLRTLKSDKYPELATLCWPQQQNGGSVGLAEFFPLFRHIYKLTEDEQAVKMATWDVLEEFQRDGVRYLELRSTPRAVESTGMTKETYVRAVLAAMDGWTKHQQLSPQNQHKHGVMVVRLILCVDRRESLEEALATVQLALRYHRTTSTLADALCHVVGVDLCGNPEVGDPSTWTPAFQLAKSKGLKLTVHLGEVPYNLAEGLTLLAWQPDRVGHATLLKPATRAALYKGKIPVEVCLTSNVQSQTVASYDDHFIKEFYRVGHPFVPCTDDKGVFGCSLTDEYERLATVLQLDYTQLFNISRQCLGFIFDEDVELQRQLQAEWTTWEQSCELLRSE
ncbi:hypothetical protein IWQ62_003762 [Dispira parvispora]|uniref:Adenosine deaminase domain-containing protein n=1 Tax=Dispira parvispora TaxID=1520584 RepID=A0A9W8AQA6_9FUNG|nr:hypothetical protein IWQ62_003762 [Dispira parvispora]